MNLAVWLDRQARAAPERQALFWGKDTVATYSQERRARRGLSSCLWLKSYRP